MLPDVLGLPCGGINRLNGSTLRNCQRLDRDYSRDL